MTPAEFNALELDKRNDAIWEWGFFVSKRTDGEVTKVLYALNGFFAETTIRISDNSLVSIRAFSRQEQDARNAYSISSDNPFVVLADHA